jgi:predicted  nucleic acid-binding Zn-ribbon protein
MAGSPAEAVTLEQYGELEVKVIKLRRALAHAQSVTKRQDAALSKTINRLQALDEEVQELKDEGSRLEDEIQNLETELELAETCRKCRKRITLKRR